MICPCTVPKQRWCGCRGDEAAAPAPSIHSMTTAEWQAKYEKDGRVDLWLEEEFNAGSRLEVCTPPPPTEPSITLGRELYILHCSWSAILLAVTGVADHDTGLQYWLQTSTGCPSPVGGTQHRNPQAVSLLGGWAPQHSSGASPGGGLSWHPESETSKMALDPYCLTVCVQGGRDTHKGLPAGFGSGEGPSGGAATVHTVKIFNRAAGQEIDVQVPEDRYVRVNAPQI